MKAGEVSPYASIWLNWAVAVRSGRLYRPIRQIRRYPLAWQGLRPGRVVLILVLLGMTFLVMACQPSHRPSRETFDEAESAYRIGNYDVARQNYALFLKQNPDPQLARLAERRLLSIEREFENVMGQKTGPRPVYVAGESPTNAVPSQQPQIFQNTPSAMRSPAPTQESTKE